jgi:hypothetical protein
VRNAGSGTRLWRGGVVAVMAAIGIADAYAQANRALPPATGGTQSGTRPLSPSVQGTFMSRDGAIQVIVLWRGQPGWFFKTSGQSGGAGGSGNTYWITERYGDIQLEMDVTDGVTRVQGTRVDRSNGENVVLVDGVDVARAAVTITALHVDLPIVDQSTRLVDIFNRSPEAAAFLRCGQTASLAGLTPEQNRMVMNRINSFVCDDLASK